MGNLFIGFPVPRAKIAEMIVGYAPPLAHAANHLPAGSDEIVDDNDITPGQFLQWNGTKFVGIDAPSGGIATRYADSDIFLCTNFESLDGFKQIVTNSGAITLNESYVDLYTNTTSGSTAYITKTHNIQYPMGTWDKARKFRADAYFWSNPDETGLIYIGMGRAYNLRHVGFFVEDGVLKGTTHNGSSQSETELEDWGSGTYATSKRLEAIFTPGSKAEFYVAGVKEGEITTNLPSGYSEAEYWIFAYVANSEAEKRNRFRLSQFQFTQAE